jgi:hypothetical protein
LNPLKKKKLKYLKIVNVNLISKDLKNLLRKVSSLNQREVPLQGLNLKNSVQRIKQKSENLLRSLHMRPKLNRNMLRSMSRRKMN